MSDWLRGVKVPPRQIHELQELAGVIRASSGLTPDGPFPVLHFFELSMGQIFDHYDYEIFDELPDGDEGRAYPDGTPDHPEGPVIHLLRDVYERAANNKGRARLTILHECGHVVLHRRIAVYHRGPKGADLKTCENSEWQANQFAVELLMPKGSFTTPGDLEAYVRRMGVSREAACNRARQLHRRNDIVLPAGWPIAAHASAFKREGGLPMGP